MSGVVATADAAAAPAPAAAEDGPKSFARRDHLASMEATAQAKWREEKLFEVCIMPIGALNSTLMATDEHEASLTFVVLQLAAYLQQ